MPLTFDQIRRAAEADVMPADVAAAFVVAGQEYFRAAGKMTLEQAIGVAVSPGGDPWHARLRRERSTAALRAVSEMLCLAGTTTNPVDALRSQRSALPTALAASRTVHGGISVN